MTKQGALMTPETTTAPKRTRKTAVRTAATKAATSVAKTPVATTRKRSMSDDHKSALAQGRTEGRVVTNYLNALETNRPKRGRKRTAESITRRLEAIEQRISDADPINRLQLIQERLDLETELGRLAAGTDLSVLEESFIQVAKSYGERKGITKAAWLSLQVPRNVLQRAGI